MVAELEKINWTGDGGFRAEWLNDKGGFWHFHPEYELTLNLKSNGTRIIGDNAEIFDQYDLTLIGGNIPHCWNHYKNNGKIPGDYGMTVHFSKASFSGPFLDQFEMSSVKALLEDSDRGIAFSTDDAKKSEKYFRDMVSHSGIDKMIDFFNLLKILVDSNRKRTLCSENYKMLYDEHGNKKMTDVYTYIRENFNKQLSLIEVSKHAGLSPFAFSRFFKKNCGAGFVEYLTQVRTNKACYLLRETDYQVQDIASECGFTSISNFNKQFRKTVGLSPRDYRLQYV
jgi:AraC-like DNA-binding protein